MSEFSQLLQNHLERRHLKVKDMARFCQVDERVLQRICRGHSIPQNDELLQKIIYFLSLSPDERDGLLDAWCQCRFGSQAYKQFHRILTYLTTFNPSAYNLNYQFVPSTTGHTCEMLTVYDNPSALSDAVLTHFTEADTGEIQILFQPEQETITELLYSFAGNFKVPVRHYLCLDSPVNGGSNIFKILSQSVKLLSKLDQYTTRFYYGNASAQFDQFALFPCMIVTDKSVLTFSSDLRHGIAYRNPEEITLFKDYLKKLDDVCYTLFHTLKNFEEQCQLFSGFEGEFSVLSAQPYLPAFLSQINPYEHIPADFPRRDSVCESLSLFLDALNKSKVMQTVKSYFTASGLNHFAKEGYFSELPNDFMPSLPMAQRLILLKEIRKTIEKDQYFLLSETFQSMNDSLHIALYEQKMTLLIRNTNNTIITAVITEPNMIMQFHYFFDHLADYHLVLPKETALHTVDRIIQLCENSLFAKPSGGGVEK